MPDRSDGNAAPDAGLDALGDDALRDVNKLWTVVRALSNTAHDVNNALQVISGNAEMLEALDLDPAVRTRVEVIRDEAGKAATTIERLLSYSREGVETVQALDLASLVDVAVAMRASSLNRAGIGIRVERSDSDPYWVLAERRRTLQAVLSLLLSSEEAVGGHGNACLTLRLERMGGEAIVSITGPVGREEATALPVNSSLTATIAAATTMQAAARLAVAPGGRVSVSMSEAGHRTLALAFEEAPGQALGPEG